MTAAEWLEAFCEEIGAPVPSVAEIDEVLRLASVAAHASERKAAPVACFVAGKTGRPLGELIATAERVPG